MRPPYARCLMIAASAALITRPALGHTQEKQANVAHHSSAAPPQDPLYALFHSQEFEQAAISPDGSRVAWVETQKNQQGMKTGKSALYVSERQSGKPLRLTAAAGGFATEHDAAWSPDGKSLAFLSDAAKPGQFQLYVVAATGGTPRKLTSANGLLANPKWAPDGKSIAILYTEGETASTGPLMPQPQETGVIKDAFYEQRLAVVNVVGGSLQTLTPADTYIYEYDWMPNGRGFVATAAKGNGDNNWWIAELYTVDASAKSLHPLYKPKWQIAVPTVSPDGKSVAFVEGLMSDEDFVGGDVMLLPLEGGAPRNLTPNRKGSASTLTWTRDGKLIDAEAAAGQSSIARIDPATGNVEDLYRAAEIVSSGWNGISLSLTPDATLSACVKSSFNAPPEVWAGPIGNWKQVTTHNAGMKPAWGEVKSIEWQSDGQEVQGWLIAPKDFDPSKKYPMIVVVHGGPAGAVEADWPTVPFNNVMALPARGYFVFRPNPRGSYGKGEEFTQANIRDFGYGDWRDVMAGVDAVLASAPVDPQRLGLTGWSYGGYMTMWGVTQTDRFKAAVAGAGIVNLASYYGENKIDQWMIPYFGKSVYDDPEIYAKSSPLTFIKNVKTPTLVVVGDSDGECPMPQSFEFWHALRTLGVETELVVYKNEGHMFLKPPDIRDVIRRTGAWFDAHLK
jgi:dipeptidyl aminopeptidase/acylaminoacyl peptidase